MREKHRGLLNHGAEEEMKRGNYMRQVGIAFAGADPSRTYEDPKGEWECQ